MADEPNHVVLVLLREIRATQAEHTERLERVERRLEGIDGRINDESRMITHALGLGTGAVVRSREAAERSEQSNARLDELFARAEALETR